MILVDTNVVITYQRTGDVKLEKLFRTLPVAICGITRAEILYGARNQADRANLLILLAAFQLLPIPETVWDAVGDHLAALRAAGVVAPFTDVTIATVGIVNDVELWTRDQQFKMIQGVLPALKLFQEPP